MKTKSPKSDAAYNSGNKDEMYKASAAMERENGELKEFIKSLTRLAKSTFLSDKMRMDFLDDATKVQWIEIQTYPHIKTIYVGGGFIREDARVPIRAAIDKAITESSHKEQ